MTSRSTEHELDILQSISQSDGGVRQRDLARIIGLSLGMTNAILKRLAQKGWLKIRKVNNRNIKYVVSPQGMEEIARRSYSYFRRTIKNVVYYKETIDRLLVEVSRRGFRKVVLVGRSDLDFIVEHLCAKHRLGFGQARPDDRPGESCGELFALFSEKSQLAGDGHSSASLRELLAGRGLLSVTLKRE